MIRFTNWQEQLVLGCLLGRASLSLHPRGKNPCLTLRANEVEADWLHWVADELAMLARPSSFQKYRNMVVWVSKSHRCLLPYYNLCYQERQKTISMAWLDKLHDTGLAAWFIERGFRDQYGIGVRTKQAELVGRYFSEVGFGSTVDGDEVYVTNSDKFIHTIAHNFPELIERKLK